MAIYYVQITSAWQGDRYHTVYKTTDKALADHMADELKIGENHFGERNPGLSGKRLTRHISRTLLQRRDGVAAVRIAEDESEMCWWDDAPVNHHTGVPYEHHTPHNIAEEIRIIVDAWRDREDEGATDFLLRDIPDPTHAGIKSAAEAAGITMREWILAAVEHRLTPTVD